MSIWFEEARFGMFIHWGLYALAGGVWKGMDVPWVSEWLMRKFKVPVAEYEKLANQFRAENFNADEWARTAAEAGMKYMVITSKHHDGFCMFKSAYDKYNIVDATPFGRDPMKELAQACRKYGLRLGFYYSQDQDWHEAGASGNTWDFPPEVKTPEAFQAYLDGKVKFQLKELLTNYGDIAIIWFDTPNQINERQSADLKDYVHSLQPNCLVSGRVGNGKGDYESLGDNQMPSGLSGHLCEGLGTMNESWGYKSVDTHYKTGDEILRTLCRMASHNCNYLLNVGPDGTGSFPVAAKQILRKTGTFLQKYPEALYGTTGLDRVGGLFQWGDITCKDHIFYLWVFRNFEGPLPVYGIRNNILNVSLDGKDLPFFQQHEKNPDYHKLGINLPDDMELPSVVKVELDGAPDFNKESYSSSDF